MELRWVAFPLLLMCACGPDASPAPNNPAPSPPATTSSVSGDGDTDAGTAPSSAGTKTLFVSEKKADCEGGEGPRKCLQVRSKESEPWTFFYSTIEGFTYEEGTKYQLEVEAVPRPNPPQDASSMKYKLLKIVAQEKVAK
jgi:hypothetical protein